MSEHLDDKEIRRVEEIISNLPDEDRELMERYQAMATDNLQKFAAAAIAVRNFSHNLGPHCAR